MLKTWFLKELRPNAKEVLDFAQINRLAPGELLILSVGPESMQSPVSRTFTVMYYAEKELV